MTDLEMTRLCAEAMGLKHYGDDKVRVLVGDVRTEYDPLQYDAQAMALVKKFRLCISNTSQGWSVWGDTDDTFEDVDLNRAICSAVATISRMNI